MDSSRDLLPSSSAQFRARNNILGSSKRPSPPQYQPSERDRSAGTVLAESHFRTHAWGHPFTFQKTFSSLCLPRWIVMVLTLFCVLKFTFDVLESGLTAKQSKNGDHNTVSPLDALPQAFRLSRLADLHNPHEFQPFFIHPSSIDSLALNITACVCITPLELDKVSSAATAWPGFLSVVFVYPSPLSKSKRIRLRNRLKSVARSSKLRARMTVHTYSISERVSPPCNALLNLARFLAPTSTVLLAPSISILESLGQHSEDPRSFGLSTTSLPSFVVEQRSKEGDGSPSTLSTTPPRSGVGDVLSSSTALVLDRDNGVWCPERFLSSPRTQWLQCLWFAWLQSLGEYRQTVYQGGRYIGRNNDASVEEVAPNILEQIDQLLIPKFRSEACIHLSRNLDARRGGEMKENRDVSAGSVVLAQKEWLRGACPEAVEMWGEAFF